MRLGATIWAWFAALPPVVWYARHVVGANARRDIVLREVSPTLLSLLSQGRFLDWAAGAFSTFFYVWFGAAWLDPRGSSKFVQDQTAAIEEFTRDPQGFTLRKLHEFGESPATVAFATYIGTVVTEPVLSLLEDMGKQEHPDPHEFARRFHGIASGLPWASQTLDSLFKMILGERAPQIGNSIMSLYWGLGLGFLGWQTLAPLLSTGLQPNLQRYYNRLYHPERFNPSQAMDLYALGKLSKGDFYNVLLDQGWRAEDVSLWIEQSYRTLSGGELWDLYHSGEITKAEMDRRLRALGYNPADLPLLYKSNEKDDTKDTTRYLTSTLKDAFLAGRMAEDEFRQILTSMKYAPREIDLQVMNLLAQKGEETRALTTGQVHTLYSTRVIGKDEAIHALRDLDYTAQVAAQLVQSWDNAALPKAARLNKSTILEGYTQGVLNRQETLDLLRREAGYPEDKAELLVKIEEAGVKITVAPPTVGAVSLAQLDAFVAAGLITREEVLKRAELARYSAEDRTRLVELMYTAAQVVVHVAEVSESLLRSAYVYGVLTREELLGRLTGRGYTAEDAEIIVATTEADNPEVFGELVPALLKQPSIGSLQLALQRGMIDEAAFRAKVSAQGYTADAVEIFLFNAQYQAPIEPKQLTKADVMRLFRDTIIGRAEVQRRLIALGYTTVDVELLIRSERVAVEDTEAAEWFAAGLLDEIGLTTILTDWGFSPDEIATFFERCAAGEFG